MKESFVIYNVIPSKGKLDKIHNIKDPDRNAASKLSNKCNRKDYAYILNVDGSAKDILDTLLTLHNYGISWKRNQLFYNENGTNFLVFDFDSLSEGAASDLREYASTNKDKCILVESNSYNPKLDKYSFKLFHITHSIIPAWSTFYNEYMRIGWEIFYWRFHIRENGTHSNYPDLAFASNLLQVVYNQVRIQLPEGCYKVSSKNWEYHYHENIQQRFMDEEDGLPMELPRKEWTYQEASIKVDIGKYKDIRSLFPHASLEDCWESGHIPEVSDRTRPFSIRDFDKAKRKNIKNDDNITKEELYLPKAQCNNYGRIPNLSEKYDSAMVHVHRFLPISMSNLCKEFGLHFVSPIFAPFYRIPIMEPETKKGRKGRHKRFLLPRIRKCIFNLIVANHVLRNNGIPYQYDLYSILAHINHYINTRFTDLDDFRKDHDNRQLYDLIYKMYRETRIKDELLNYQKERHSTFLYHSNYTKDKRLPYLNVIEEHLDGKWSLFNKKVLEQIINAKPELFKGIPMNPLYQWIMRHKVPKLQHKPSHRGTYNSKHKTIKELSPEQLEQYRIEKNISKNYMNKLIARHRT